jgi:ribose 1,5-bisphosphokinase PhnN
MIKRRLKERSTESEDKINMRIAKVVDTTARNLTLL